jgi:hypothetical protein
MSSTFIYNQITRVENTQTCSFLLHSSQESSKMILSFRNQITTNVQIKKEKVDKVEETNVIEIFDVNLHAVDPMNMTMYSDVVSDKRNKLLQTNGRNVFRFMFQICKRTNQKK